MTGSESAKQGVARVNDIVSPAGEEPTEKDKLMVEHEWPLQRERVANAALAEKPFAHRPSPDTLRWRA